MVRAPSAMLSALPWRAHQKKRSPVIPVFLSCIYLLVLFLGIMSYMYGSLYQSSQRAHNLKVLAVDYDGGTIGRALHAAYTRLQAPDFVSLDFQPASEYPDPSSVSEAICTHGYWAVIYTRPGATQRLLAAVAGNNSTPYNASDAITYVYNGVYYPVIGEAYIGAEMEALAAATSQALYGLVGTELLSTVTANANVVANRSSAVSALFQPIRASSMVLSPADNGARVLLNTVTMVVPPLMQFFFVVALDHISAAMRIFSRDRVRTVYLGRLVGSKTFSFIGSLAVAGFIYGFREDWALDAAQFVETWLCFWFYMDICYLVMDTFIGTMVPMRFAPFFIFTWVIINVTSTLFPFELNPGFYRWGYALPAHNVWLLLMSVWSHGCIERLRIALPILFAWWLVGSVTSAIAVWRKCAKATASAPHDDIPPALVNKELGETAADPATDGQDDDTINKASHHLD